jgi:hypothetical protein
MMAIGRDMAERFKKYLCVSTETSRFAGEGYFLNRVSWMEISQINNLSDYDHIYLNLTALAEFEKSSGHLNNVERAFNPYPWADILTAGGSIFLVGDPAYEIAKKARGLALLQNVLTQVAKDERALDYRRINKPFEGSQLYAYLDSVSSWAYSWRAILVGSPLANELQHRTVTWSPKNLGCTTYSTFLAVQYDFSTKGTLTILPSSGNGVEVEDLFVLQTCFGIPTALEAPKWVNDLTLPEQTELQQKITQAETAIEQLRQQATALAGDLRHCRRWYRLLYDDGDSLEEIVEEGFKLLGASIKKISKVKDDYRLERPGFAKAVVEIKGTHNAQFPRGPLRQLAGWMDEATSEEHIVFKGVFVGNAARKDEPLSRGNLFDHNSNEYAKVKEMTTMRAMDLYCLVLMQTLGMLNEGEFWKEFFECKGQFDASKYWVRLPPRFQLGRTQQAVTPAEVAQAKPLVN